MRLRDSESEITRLRDTALVCALTLATKPKKNQAVSRAQAIRSGA